MISTGKELREAYLEYFKNLKDFPHPIVPSSPIVPPDDPSLLFTSAGMVQFKRLYSGEVDPLPYPRAASCQKCLRAGGKGSDLENVGKTLRHHTFFEMLGNFSFGDYFKRETILFAWEFAAEVMGLPAERLFPTVYLDDDEAAKIWREETGCVYEPIRLDEKENFWGPAGDAGACGPCSELCFFLGSEEELKELRKRYMHDEEGTQQELARRIPEEGDTFLEIWNMVFPQFDQQRDGTRLPLKHKGIDTGAGLERMTVALMFARTGKYATPYETDLMWPIVDAAAKLLEVPYVKASEEHGEKAAKERLAVNAIADHVRALVFCLAEGLMPGNVGRRYVIRRIQRRALRFASIFGVDRPIMAELYDPVVEAMGDAYPEIKKNPDFIRKALRIEDETFLRTRDRGMKMLNSLVEKAKDSGKNVIAGEDAFKLWDTYGFPYDLTIELAEDEGLRVDREGFDEAMQRQKEEARKSWKGEKLDFEVELLDELHEIHGASEFLGYHGTGPVSSEVLGFIHHNSISDVMKKGEEGMIVLRETPFYAEAGGQIGDTGVIAVNGSRFNVEDTQKTPHGIYVHKGHMKEGEIKAGEIVEAKVDEDRREKIRRNHSSVHLLQNALKRLVGDHITQAGSYVGPDYSRFDFTHTESLSREQLEEVQREVNRLILEDTRVETDVLPLEEAKKKGAIAVFGEKYGATVRVISMAGGQSVEFCGGTHVDRTGQIAHYRIIAESSIASGVRRIEAVTGFGALEEELQDQYEIVAPLQSTLATKGPEVLDRVKGLQARVKELEKEVAKYKQQAALKDVDSKVANAIDLDGKATLAVARLDGMQGGELRTAAVSMRDKLGEQGIAAVLADNDGKVQIVVAVGAQAQKEFPAGKVVNALAGPLGGRGGGKPDIAQAGAKDASKLDEVMNNAKDLVAKAS